MRPKTETLFHRALFLTGWLLCLILLLQMGPDLAQAQGGPPGQTPPLFEKPEGKLSYRLSLLAEPALSGQDVTAQAEAVGLPAEGAGSLIVDEQQRLLVYIRLADVSEENLDKLQTLGVEITHVAELYHVVTGFIPFDDLPDLEAEAVVESVQEVLAPEIARSSLDRRETETSAPTRPAGQADCPTAITSEGDIQLNAAAARTAFGVDGSGVTVGILSDSFDFKGASGAADSALADIVRGDLPGSFNPCGRTNPVLVLEEGPLNSSLTDEGRAMSQIVHDLAPGANLTFATAYGPGSLGMLAFADNIRDLRNVAGADVIVDDVGYFEEPFYQDGPVGVAIKDVTTDGSLYFTSAGNDHQVDISGNVISSYEASAYRPTTCPILFFQGQPILPGVDCHGFNPLLGTDNSLSFILAPGGTIQMIFQWAEAWYGLRNDLDIFLVDDFGNILALGPNNNQTTVFQSPFELFTYQNPNSVNLTVNFVVSRADSVDFSTPAIKYILTQSTQGILATEYNATNSTDIFGPSIYGHASTNEALSIAAVPYNDATVPQDFTSQGYATHYFLPTVGINPALAFFVPQIRFKPDVAATNGGANTFFGVPDGPIFRFFGTSASAPHAAAVAALMKQRANRQNITLDQLTTAEVLQATAAPIAFGFSKATGAGLIDALNAVGVVNPLQLFTIIEPTSLRSIYAGPAFNPQKISLQVSKPEPNLTTDKFSVIIGDAPAKLITLLESPAEYVLEVRPPTQSANGAYDLTVTATTSVGDISDTEVEAVYYNDTNNINIMLTLDRSGSMLLDNNLIRAKNAAKQFVDLMQTGDHVGVSSFADNATLDFPLSPVNPINHSLAKSAIDPLIPNGATAMGVGLQLAQYELFFKADPFEPWAIVLLGDGFENVGPYVNEVLPSLIIPSKTRVHTIALGSIANEPQLLDIAQKTGGTYNLAPSGLELATIYNNIAGIVTRLQLLGSFGGNAVLGVTDVKKVTIDPTVSQVIFPLSWANSDSLLSFTLLAPNGKRINPAVAALDPNVEYVEGPTYAFYRVSAPTLISGVWEMEIFGATIVSLSDNQQVTAAAESEPYTVQAIGQTDLSLRAYTDKANYQAGEPVTLSISLSDDAAIKDAHVLAVVGSLIKAGPPSAQGAGVVLQLVDDGSQGDQRADDGIYTGLLPGSETGNEGSYTFSIFANGTSNGNEFAREVQHSIFVGDQSLVSAASDDVVAPQLPEVVYLPLIIK